MTTATRQENSSAGPFRASDAERELRGLIGLADATEGGTDECNQMRRSARHFTRALTEAKKVPTMRAALRGAQSVLLTMETSDREAAKDTGVSSILTAIAKALAL